jgi:hypothetical protein
MYSIEGTSVRKHSRKKNHRFRTETFRTQTKRRAADMKLEDLAVYVRRAEKEALPIIQERELSAGAAIFLVAQYTQAFVTGKPDVTIESARDIASRVLLLWQTGSYQPGPAYPFSFEETVFNIEHGMHAQQDYSDHFQPFTPVQTNNPVGLRQIAGGIVRHPKTHLWQIWIRLDDHCEFLGAYRDPMLAQQNLAELIYAVRQGKKPKDASSLYQQLMSQAESEPQSLPFDMMAYLIENIQKYTIML